MMDFLRKILAPKETQFRDLSLQDIEKTLQSPVIQHKWLLRMVDKLQIINMELDALLAKPDKDRIWETLAIERRTIIRCLTLILDVRDEMESERVSQEAQNALFERYRGISAPSGIQ